MIAKIKRQAQDRNDRHPCYQFPVTLSLIHGATNTLAARDINETGDLGITRIADITTRAQGTQTAWIRLRRAITYQNGYQNIKLLFCQVQKAVKRQDAFVDPLIKPAATTFKVVQKCTFARVLQHSSTSMLQIEAHT